MIAFFLITVTKWNFSQFFTERVTDIVDQIYNKFKYNWNSLKKCIAYCHSKPSTITIFTDVWMLYYILTLMMKMISWLSSNQKSSRRTSKRNAFLLTRPFCMVEDEWGGVPCFFTVSKKISYFSAMICCQWRSL